MKLLEPSVLNSFRTRRWPTAREVEAILDSITNAGDWSDRLLLIQINRGKAPASLGGANLALFPDRFQEGRSVGAETPESHLPCGRVNVSTPGFSL